MARPIKKFDICIGRVDKDNPERKFWDRIGEAVVWPADNGGERMSGRLFHIPDTQIIFFEQKPREGSGPSAMNNPAGSAPSAEDEINIEDIPF